ncbi:MAG: o-succinylbenzoate synthase, partial [Bacteroidales bacterium]|nr:o-succinylbenzoate synthase [Bacteroidales bacterium]
MQLSYIQRTFHFNFAAYTSRGTLLERTCWFLILQDNEKLYIGECAPIPGLSPEPLELIPDELDAICRFFNAHHHFPPINTHIFPSIAFAVESISKQISNLQSSLLYPSSFTTGTDGISINGLIWAGSREKVLKQIDEKIDARFPCIKIKIGALPFEEEIEILKNVRQLYPQIEIRLDANGAFAPDEALDKLEQLA